MAESFVMSPREIKTSAQILTDRRVHARFKARVEDLKFDGPRMAGDPPNMSIVLAAFELWFAGLSEAQRRAWMAEKFAALEAELAGNTAPPASRPGGAVRSRDEGGVTPPKRGSRPKRSGA